MDAAASAVVVADVVDVAVVVAGAGDAVATKLRLRIELRKRPEREIVGGVFIFRGKRGEWGTATAQLYSGKLAL